jgi:hypothetical protein
LSIYRRSKWVHSTAGVCGGGEGSVPLFGIPNGEKKEKHPRYRQVKRKNS